MAADETRSPQTGATPFGLPYTDEELALIEKYSRRLTGSCNYSLDSKGRMVVPATYRDSLGSGFVICPSADFKSIALYANIVWIRLRESYAGLVSRNPALTRFLERFDAYSFRGQECDAQGRVLLPVKLRQLVLGDEKEVEISGAGDHIRVAPAQKDQEDMADFLSKLPDILETIATLDK